jgi:hypothetical protein
MSKGIVAVGACVVVVSGCGFLMPHAPPPQQHTAPANPAVMRFYDNFLAASERPEGDCDKMIEQRSDDLSAAIDKALHDEPRPGMQVPTPSAVFTKLKAEKVTFTMKIGAGGVPVIEDSITQGREQWRVPPQNAKEKAEFEAFKAKDAKVGWVVDELRVQIAGFSQAFLRAHWLGKSAQSGASIMARTAWTIEQDPSFESLVERSRALVKKNLRCMHRATKLEATATAIFAAYQAAASGDHADVADKVVTSSHDVLPVKDDATDAEVDKELEAIDEEVKAAYAKAGVNWSPMAASPDESAFLPDGSPARKVADGADAAMKGDYRTAIKAIAPYAPSPLGTVLDLAVGLFGG